VFDLPVTSAVDLGDQCADPIYFAGHVGECVSNGVGDVVSNGARDGLQEIANQILEGFGTAMASIGTMWVAVPTPVLAAGSATSSVVGVPPGADSFSTILSYVTYVGLTLAALSLVALGALVAVRSRRGDGMRNLGSLGIILMSVLLISGASALVGGLLGANAPEGSSSAVGFLQNSLWYYVGAVAVLSVIVGGIRMAWEQRAQPGKEVLQSLITLVVVSGTGLAVVTLGVTAADAFAVWVLENSTECGVSDAGQSTCFGTNLAGIMGLGMSISPGVGLIGTILLGSLALLMTFVQVALMVVRGGMLVILAGVLPLAASFTNTQMGKQWFGKITGWTIAFILYKPAAALIYAAAFQLVGADAFQDDGKGLWEILTGIALMLMALLALPALMKFIAPMTSATGGGGNAGMALAAAGGAGAGEVASGAVKRMSSSTSTGGGAGSGSGSVSNAPSGSSSGGGASRPAPVSGGASSSGGASPAPAGGAATAGRSVGGAALGSGATAGGASVAGGAVAGGGASAGTAGGAAAGAAAGPAAPVVIGAQVAAGAAKKAATTAGNVAKGVAQDATEESSGPSGAQEGSR
jgi:type IV secretion system protein TrbL